MPRCSTAWATIEWTSLMTGASLSASSSEQARARVGLGFSSMMSSIDSVHAPRCARAAGPEVLDRRPRPDDLRPVIIAMSSIVRTLVGSAIASSSEPSSMKPTGTAW